MTDIPQSEPPSCRRRAAWLCAFTVAGLGWFLCLIGIGLHLLVGDCWGSPWCFFYYALPRPLLCALATGSALLTPRSFPRWRTFARVTVAVLLVWVLVCDFGWHWGSRSTTESTLRVAQWNACHLPRGRERAADVIRSFDADLVGVVEAGGTLAPELAEWERLLPGYAAQSNRPGMLWLARLPATSIEPVVVLGPRSDAVALNFEMSGTPCRAVLVDIVADFGVARVPILQELTRQLERWEDRPFLLLGDFNAPPESCGFRALRDQSRNAFSAAGSGYAATWPVPFPVLTLDQIWTSPDWQARACRPLWTNCSDHRPVVAELTITTIPRVAKSQR